MNTKVLWREEFNQNFNILNNTYLELQRELVPGDGSTFLPMFKDFPNDIVVGTQLRQENSESLLPFVINAGADGASLRLQLDTYNPTAGTQGDSYLGTSIKTKDTFNLQNGRFAFEGSLRLVDSNENPLSRGIIAGFFSYTPIIVDGKRDEIDFEILSNFIDDGQNDNTEPSIFTNVFNDDDFNQRGDFSVVNLGDDVSGLEGIDLTAFNKYRIEWDTNEIKWFINDVEIRSEINNIPDRDMSIYLNIWANGFEEAVDESLLPASNPQSNETFYYDIDYLQLERFDAVLNDPLFRFQNENVPGTYLFAGEEEAQNIRDNYSPPFVEEGFAFYVSFEEKDNLVRFNRFQSNFLPGTYIFANEKESESIRANFSEEFTEEGIAFYAYGADADMGQDVFRFRNMTNNTYLFVLGEEAISVRQNYADVFVEEGVAFEVRV